MNKDKPTPPQSFTINPNSAQSEWLNIIEQINHIKGCATAGTCYDQISSDPLKESVEDVYSGKPVLSRSEADNLEVYTMAGGYSPELIAEATSAILFSTKSSLDLNIALSVVGSDPVGGETGSTLLLTNLTLGIKMLNIRLWHDYMPDGEPSEWADEYHYENHYTFILEPNNKYELSVYSKSSSSEDSWFNRTKIEVSETIQTKK